MRCPHCTSVDLVMSERAGIEIDYCPKCRGVWLDRGELDKIIDRAGAATAQPQAQPQSHPQPMPPQGYPMHGKPDDSHYGYPSPHGKRRKSWLSEIFD